MGPSWLKDAVFYEVYPQSFYDSNGDGIGDLEGIIRKLEYIRDLGCNAVWLNPIYDSPFKDAGYDVRDYRKVAPRYGTMEDARRLFRRAHDLRMHVLMDLIPGHTSEEHPWFLESQKAERNRWSDRYIWTDSWFHGAPGMLYIGGESERDGTYILNFFKCQPALNYGFLHPSASWQLPADHPEAIATREAIKDIMRFWLDAGCDGFRVDMADSLVKMDDARKHGTCAVWRNVREMLDREYPEAAMISEWSAPDLSLNAGFHMDFYLNHDGNGYESLLRDVRDGRDRSYFRKDAEDRDIRRFLDEYEAWYASTRETGYISLMTGNHDIPRCAPRMSIRELKLAYAVLLTLPGVPFVYYGDEIGMRYRVLPTKEGGYTRTGSRTPMQWQAGKNLGFSEAAEKDLYLPVDPSEDAPTVEEQERDPDSLLRCVRDILELRHRFEDLQSDGAYETVVGEKDQPYVYRRGSLLMAVNPEGRSQCVMLPEAVRQMVYRIGEASVTGECLQLPAQSFAVLKVQTHTKD